MKRYLLISLLVCTPFAQAALQLVPLSNTSPQDLIFKVEALLKPGETVIAGHNELIIRASEETLATLLPVIKNLDQPSRQLMILVSRDGRVVSRDRGYEVNAVARIGVGSGNNSRLNGHANVFNDSSVLNESGVQKIRVLDGRQAFISTGVQQPIKTIERYGDAHHYHETQTTQYRDASRGFYVTPTLISDKVVLQVSRWADEPLSADGLSAKHSHASSTIRGHLNQWMELGGIDELSSSQSSEILGSRRSSRAEKNSIWVKVVPVTE